MYMRVITAQSKQKKSPTMKTITKIVTIAQILLAFFKHFDKLGGTLKISAVLPELAKQFEEIHLNNIIPIGT